MSASSAAGKTSRRYLRAGLWLVLAVAAVGALGLWRYRVTRPEYRLKQGQEALYHGDIYEADRCAASLEAAGYADHAHLLRGQIYLHQGQLNPAVVEYNQIDHENVDVLAPASLIYGLALLSVNRLVEAEKFLVYVASTRPEEKDAHRGLAAIYYDRGAMENALPHLQRWIDLDPEEGRSHRFMALIFKDMSVYAESADHYRQALKLRLPVKDRKEAIAEFAEVLLQMNEYEECLACLDGYPGPEAPPAPILELRAECLKGMGRGSEALQALEQAQKKAPPSLRWQRVRAQLYIDAGDFPAAIGLLEKALRIDPHDVTCRHHLALAYAQVGRKQEAAEQGRLLDQSRRLYQELSELNTQDMLKPTDAAVRRKLAEVCNRLSKPELAQMWLRAAEACPAQ
jgi:tetratricopeptide (TPR) repeat protein